MDYTDEQQDAAKVRDSRVLIRALAGTGKTETVAHRASLLADEDRKISSVLCFTRASRDMLTNRFRDRGVDVDVKTVHASAYEAVRTWHEAHELTMPRVNDGERIVRELLQSAGFGMSATEVDAVLRASTGRWNGTNVLTSVPSTMTVADVRALADMYQAAKRKRGVIDFDDLVVMAAEVVTPGDGEVIVDEAQDLSTVQVAYVEALAGNNAMTWVGDPHQAVFGFAGVDGGLFDRLDGWTERTLTRSFRSKQGVLDVANQLIGGDSLHSRDAGGEVKIKHVSYGQQVEAMAQAVETGHAILTRTRDSGLLQSERLERDGWVVRRNCEATSGDCRLDVSTVHSAKGSEWQHIAIMDMTQDGFNGFERTDEERRLFYVALTRARQSVTIYSLDGCNPWEVRL